MTTINPRTATVTIYHGDDLERLAGLHLAAEVEKRREAGAALRIGDDVGGSQAARDAYNAAVDEAAERAVVVRINQLGHKAFRALLTEHTPREGNKADEAQGFNEDTFPEALLLDSIVEPEMSRTSLGNFLDTLADGDFDRLFFTAYELNRAVGADPKATRFSEAAPRSSETSESPARLG